MHSFALLSDRTESARWLNMMAQNLSWLVLWLFKSPKEGEISSGLKVLISVPLSQCPDLYLWNIRLLLVINFAGCSAASNFLKSFALCLQLFGHRLSPLVQGSPCLLPPCRCSNSASRCLCFVQSIVDPRVLMLLTGNLSVVYSLTKQPSLSYL
jgi:hypothetical protein